MAVDADPHGDLNGEIHGWNMLKPADFALKVGGFLYNSCSSNWLFWYGDFNIF